MAQYLGATVGEWVPGNWDSLPDSIKINNLGIGNQIKGTPWTIAELEQLQLMTEQEQIAAGYLGYNPGQLAMMLNRAKAAEGYYVDPQTKSVVFSESLISEASKSFVGQPLAPGLIGGVDKPFRQYWGPSNSATWGMDASGKIVQTNAPTTGEESLEETIRIASAGSRGVNALGQAGSILTRGVSFSYDNAGNIVGATSASRGPVTIEEGKKIWENFFIDNPDQLTRTNEIRKEQGLGEFTPGGLVSKKKLSTGTTPTKTVVSKTKAENNTTIVTYSDGTKATVTGDGPPVGSSAPVSTSLLATDGFTDKTLVTTRLDSQTGDFIGYFSDGSKLVLDKGTGPTQTAEYKDAFSLLKQTFSDYGLESLVPAIEGFMKRNLGANQAAIELRTTPEYIARFKGNDLRRAAGKNAVSEAEYLAIEDAYDRTLRAYGQQNYFGIDRKTKQQRAAELIGNDISAVEFKDRIELAVDRVQNADPVIKDTLKQFYPNLTNDDLVGYFLNPADNLPKLKEKVTASEIGAAAKNLKLSTSLESATDLAKYGVTQAQAREGYSNIAGVLPTASKLGDIYGETGVKYAQKEAEAEVFKGSQDASTKRKRLASMERAAFGGSSGVNQSSLGKSTQGNF